MKKVNRKTLTVKLDKMLSEIVRKSSCRRCGKQFNLQCCHIFSRNNRSVRWDFNNVLSMCAGCHLWAHANPILFTEFILRFLGETAYNNLKLRANTPKQFTIEELLKLYNDLKKINV